MRLGIVKKHLDELQTPSNYSNIPLNVYMSWCSDTIPQKLSESLDLLFNTNPEFTFHIYNDEMCRNFIEKNYPHEVVDAFDRLIPGAYKSDLWRYCILYKLGGVYMDIKYSPINKFKLINLINKEYFVLDNPAYFSDLGLFNGLMIIRPNNPVLLTCVNEIVKNVNSGFKGSNALMPTGPGLLGNVYRMYSQNKHFDIEFAPLGYRMISYKKVPILKEYSGYRDDLANLQKSDHYWKAWENNEIYRPK